MVIMCEARKQRGLEIARSKKLKGRGLHWRVPSQSGKNAYRVVLTEEPRCTCPDFEFTGERCKHIFAAEFTVLEQVNEDGSKTTTETLKVTYTQDWKSYNAAQTNEKEYFEILLSSLCRELPEPPRKQGKYQGGRKPLPFSDMTYAAIMKTYEALSARRFNSDLKEAERKGYISKAPHFNSVLNHFERSELTDALHAMIVESSKPLSTLESHFSVDSSGFSTSVKGNWKDAKYKRNYHAYYDIWVKCHIMSGARTNVVTACHIGHDSDMATLPQLVNVTSENFKMNEVSADKAYSSRKVLEFLDSHGAFPLIPFKDNTVMRNDGDVWSKMFHYFSFNREEFIARYHLRSNVESTFHMIKSKFGGNVRSKGDRAQINEVLAKILCHNICVLIQSMFEFGIEFSEIGEITS